jgi:hypothetical protein
MKNKYVLYTLCILVLALNPAINCVAGGEDKTTVPQVWQLVKEDYQTFYSIEGLKRLGIAFAVGGIIANTNTDQEIQDWYQDHARRSATDQFASAVKGFGNWKYLVPVSMVAAGIGLVFPQDTGSNIGAWGERTFRAYVVATPAMFVTQHLTGASRPEERENASHWRPLHDNNGVSGHAFVAAVPFITIARMSRNPLIRYASYAASILTAWSRVNDNAHFTSQVMLGWYMGYEAVEAVSASSGTKSVSQPQYSLIPWKDGAVVRVAYQW